MCKSRFAVLFTGIVLIGFSACTQKQESAQQNESGTVQGSCQTVFDGEICTWGKLVGDSVVEFGATVPLATAENAPLGGEMVFPGVTLARIPLPQEITDKIGINHLGVNWENYGHPPGPFLTPHFDFHFNTVSGETIEAIDCSDTSKPATIPVGYVLPDLEIPEMGTLVGICIPGMGMHSLDEEAYNATDLFEGIMIVGYYSQGVIFVEPMISREKLLERNSFAVAVPSVYSPGEGVTWPISFEAAYDEASDSYRFVFSM